VEANFAQKVILAAREDGILVEAVSLQFRQHRCVTISSQAGCSLKSPSTAIGRASLKRQLSADEIADQVLHFMQCGQKVAGVSFAGMGEPLANPRVFDALQILTAPKLVGLSSRRINISTVGIIPGIVKLTNEFPQVNLAFSLHTPFNHERNDLVPLNRMYPLENVFDALDQHILKTGRRVWISYFLLEGKTNTLEHAKALAKLIRDRKKDIRYLYHVNLLTHNSLDSSIRQGVEGFQQVLQQNGVSSSYRKSFGQGLSTVCDQIFTGYESFDVAAAPVNNLNSAVI
jgi:adenine C2-methylase RlmN of 23S rRNA A2503 and tRNA A37